MMKVLCLAAAVCATSAAVPRATPPPNIVFIMADDLGFNDISLHGSPQIPTPNIDALAQSGVHLARYYAQPVCSPTRASLMTGRHSIHTGIYMPFDHGVTNEHLNLSFTMLPAYLRRAANYSAHMVGKWHLGANTVNATPTGRGFESHVGYWSGAEDYETHTVSNTYDFFDGLTPAVALNNTWSTRIFTDAATAIIAAHAAAPSPPPLFLYLAFQNVHWPLEAPADIVARFANTTGGSEERKMVCAMAAFLDEAVGNVTSALRSAGMYDNTIVVLASDNGGPTNGDENTFSNNFPMRGGKNTLFEGGTRVVGMVRGPGVAVGAVSHSPVHVTDWLPSLVSMATGGADFRQFAPPGEPPYEAGDGLDVWSSIASGGSSPSPRDWVLLEAHRGATYLTHGDGLIVGDWKLLQVGPQCPVMENSWIPPPGQNASVTPYFLQCGGANGPRVGPAPNATQCNYPRACLFNITGDPCEYDDVAAAHPDVVATLQARLATLSATAVPPIVPAGCMPRIVQVRASDGGLAPAYQPCDAPPLPPP